MKCYKSFTVNSENFKPKNLKMFTTHKSFFFYKYYAVEYANNSKESGIDTISNFVYP